MTKVLINEEDLQNIYSCLCGIAVAFDQGELGQIDLDNLHDCINNAEEALGVNHVDEIGDGMSDVEADADTLRNAGYGTDEDYGSASDVL